MRFYSILLTALLMVGPSVAAETFGEPEFLPVDQAFQFTLIEEKGSLALLWRVEPGYYLYKHRIDAVGSERVGELLLPEGVAKFDEYFGDVEIYTGSLEASLSVLPGDEETIMIIYQGCADQGICYPPRKVDYLLKHAANSP